MISKPSRSKPSRNSEEGATQPEEEGAIQPELQRGLRVFRTPQYESLFQSFSGQKLSSDEDLTEYFRFLLFDVKPYSTAHNQIKLCSSCFALYPPSKKPVNSPHDPLKALPITRLFGRSAKTVDEAIKYFRESFIPENLAKLIAAKFIGLDKHGEVKWVRVFFPTSEPCTDKPTWKDSPPILTLGRRYKSKKSPSLPRVHPPSSHPGSDHPPGPREEQKDKPASTHVKSLAVLILPKPPLSTETEMLKRLRPHENEELRSLQRRNEELEDENRLLKENLADSNESICRLLDAAETGSKFSVYRGCFYSTRHGKTN